MSTRQGRKFIDPCLSVGVGESSAPFLSMLVNNIELTGKAIENVPPDFIVYTMAMNGGIVYMRDANEWAEFSSCGRNDRFGYPTRIKIKGDTVWSAPIEVNDEYVIFPANAEFVPPVYTLNKNVNRINEIDKNISQNLENLRAMTVVKTTSDELARQTMRLDQKRRNGETHGILNVPADDMASPYDIIDFSPNAKSYLMEYLQLKQDARQELYEYVGVAKMVEKGERRITGEVDLASDSASAVIDLLIESINKQAKFKNVDIKASRRLRAGHTCGESAEQQQESEGAVEDERND